MESLYSKVKRFLEKIKKIFENKKNFPHYIWKVLVKKFNVFIKLSNEIWNFFSGQSISPYK